MKNFTKLRERAMQIAEKVHRDQVDKAGKSYIGHPIRVERMCSRQEDRDTVLKKCVSSKVLIFV